LITSSWVSIAIQWWWRLNRNISELRCDYLKEVLEQSCDSLSAERWQFQTVEINREMIEHGSNFRIIAGIFGCAINW
jgi:hypothetical protein